MDNIMGEFSLDENQSHCNETIMGPQRDSLYVVVPILVIYAIIFLTGIVGNVSTCIVIFRNKSMHTATNYYLFSLSISDMVLLLSGLPQEAYLIYSRHPYVFGNTFCFLRGMLAETSSTATVLTITAFTIERYLAICHPFLSHTMSKLSRAVKLILAIWVVAMGWAIPHAMQFGVVTHKPNCQLCTLIYPIKHSFELSTFLFFVLPMTLITVLYVLIGQRLKTSSLMKRRNCNARIQSKSSRKVVRMLVAVVVAFFICWAPFHAQRLYSIYTPWSSHSPESHSFYMKIYDVVTYVSGVLYYVSATINPILYSIMSVKFREAFKETFARCCGLGHFKASRPRQRTYSVLSRSAQRGPDSTDSGRDDPTLHTHTTVTQKSSIESVNGVPTCLRRNKTLPGLIEPEIEEEASTNNTNNDPGWMTTICSVGGGGATGSGKQSLHHHIITSTTSPSALSESSAVMKFVEIIDMNKRNSAGAMSANRPQPRKFQKFWRYLEFFTNRKRSRTNRAHNSEENRRLSTSASAYYTPPHAPSNNRKDPNILQMDLEMASGGGGTLPKSNNSQKCTSPCGISNSSLRDVDNGALEDELTTYMREIKLREERYGGS